jgi:hypothetical protein
MAKPGASPASFFAQHSDAYNAAYNDMSTLDLSSLIAAGFAPWTGNDFDLSKVKTWCNSIAEMNVLVGSDGSQDTINGCIDGAVDRFGNAAPTSAPTDGGSGAI